MEIEIRAPDGITREVGPQNPLPTYMVSQTPLPVALVSGGPATLTDAKSGAQVVLQSNHHHVHLAEYWMASYVWPSVAADGAANLLIRTAPAREMHMTADAEGWGDFEVLLFEGVAVSANGISVPTHNRNRTTPVAPIGAFWRDPTITATGTTLFHGFGPGGRKSSATGGHFEVYDEIVLAANSQYVIQIINRAEQAGRFAVRCTFYEQEVP